MKNQASTFLKIGHKFVCVDTYEGGVVDDDYIEGAIELCVEGKEIISREHWDLVDQLWAYLLEAAYKVRDGKEYQSCFPDQPLKLRVRPIAPFSVELTVGNTAVVVGKTMFLDIISNGAYQFFSRMQDIAPQLNETWSMYASEARDLSPQT